MKQFLRRFTTAVVSFGQLLSAVSARLWPTQPPHERTFREQAILYAKRALFLFLLTSFTGVLFYRWIPVGVTPLMVLRMAETMLHGQIPRVNKEWVSIDKISPRMQAAVIAAEDQYFFEHNGIDWKAVEKAMEHNKRSRRTRGASTISQQVAKNVFLWPDRSWIRKGLELYFTTLIEIFWPKQRILEVYLNVIELGDGVYGVEAASRNFFKKHALKLSADESALLAASLPNPRKFLVNRPTGYLRFRQSLIRRRLFQVKLVHLEKKPQK